MNKETKFQQRQLVISHALKGKSRTDIAGLLQKASFDAFNYEGRIKNKPRSGRSPKLTSHKKLIILRKIRKKNPKTSTPTYPYG